MSGLVMNLEGWFELPLGEVIPPKTSVYSIGGAWRSPSKVVIYSLYALGKLMFHGAGGVPSVPCGRLDTKDDILGRIMSAYGG